MSEKIVFENPFVSKKPEKVTFEEWIAISTFFLAMIITLNFVASIFVAFFVFGAYYMIKQAVLFTQRNPKRFYALMQKWGRIFIILFIILFFIDVVLTYFAVHYFQFAVELNLFAVKLWDSFGYAVGEVLRIILFLCAIFYPLWILINAKGGDKRIFVAFIFSLACLILWLFVVIHNFILLWSYLCGG